jgi:hypothetical protein
MQLELLKPTAKRKARGGRSADRRRLHAVGHYESRATFRNLARAGGANVADLDLITHPSPKAAKDLYNRTAMLWPLMCAAVRCVKVEPRDGAAERAVPLRLAVSTLTQGYGLQSAHSAVTDMTQAPIAALKIGGSARESK